MNHPQDFPGCSTNDSNLSLINSFVSVMIYAVGSFYKFLPAATTLIPNLLTAALVAIVSFSMTKLCHWIFKKWFCK